MEIINRKRAAAGILGLAAFGAVVASAASLGTLTSESVGSSAAVVASCDSDGIAITYEPTYAAATSSYEISSVDLSGIDESCAGQNIDVTVHAVTGASIGTGTATVSGTSQSVTISAGASAADATGAAVVISG